ncbi:MAG: sugar phosphate isomerase/epimerase, partial [Firmicutes bacterium]|nr:sugar phosphate isomerase/epimerase [Bacillota bacterium]
NIPCVASDPMTHWHELSPNDSGFVYDVRFGQFQGQNEEILSSDFIKNGKIEHMHIADFGGERRDFSKIRPVLHPFEGHVDFDLIKSGLKAAGYRGTMTLESPAFENGGLNYKKLEGTLSWLREFADDISENQKDS